MALPRKLKYFNLFNDGDNYQGVVESITLPKLVRKLEDYRGGGMNGSAKIDLGLEEGAIDMEWTIGGVEAQLYRQWGSAKIDGVQLRFAGSLQRDDSGDITSIEIVTRGRHQEIDSGDYKQGDNSQTKISSKNTYYKLTINNEVIVEIDTLNMIEISNGNDLLQEHRRAIGL
ncbi:phage major tail tube protein [Candidatus Fukatsuia symbiotica]|uniref:Phage major tail tube protein n=1 Tax=Candidatus Fukatsuia symbiotica TaxID=1878942 RepID=A0A2U8I6R4_9GAMM|nr:phage major tail tube protein [Candidatus Fukatsuia symbiotica]AWK14759.1 phage major tail tube protein [Candidatus Fukatsuia symbiotica]MEA9445093.1 phage major tail tube protein [Candidatus Fukatsuia symbiotica]